MTRLGDQRHSGLERKLFLVVSLFVFIVAFVFLLATTRTIVLSTMRAYSQGEGYWSNAQKEAVISLMKYGKSTSPADFQAYLSSIRIPLGDKMARLELEKPNPDMRVVREGFTRAQYDPDDIPRVIWFYRWFHSVSFASKATAVWAAGDREIDRLTELADQLHAEHLAGHPNPQMINRVLEEIEECDSRLTRLENQFSDVLVEGDRQIRVLVNALTFGTGFLLSFLGIGTSFLLLRNVRRSEEKYARLFDAASDAILILDPEKGVVVEANGRAAELFGKRPEQLAGMPEAESFPTEELEFFRDLVRAKLAEGKIHSLSLKLRCSDGQSVGVEASLQLIDLEGTGHPVILAVLRDTSEVNRLNRALLALSRCNQELVRATNEQELLEKVCDIIVSAGGYRMAWVGFPENDEEKTVRVAAQSGDTGGYLNSIQVSWSERPGRGIAGRTIRTGEICTVHNIAEDVPDGMWTPQALAHNFRSAIALPLNSDQAVFGSLAIYSEEKGVFDTAEVNLLRELAANLAYGIRTLRVRSDNERKEAEVRSLEEQLRQAQKMESLGRLAGGVAHDFNNLLTVIRGYAELSLPSKTGDGELRRKILEIMKSSDRAQALVSQLLAFSRKQILKPSVLDLNQVVVEISEVLPRLIGEDVRVEVCRGEGLRRIKADANQMQQVLLNLAVNARDAMPKGGTLRFETANASFPAGSKFERPLDGVLLKVSDTGSGIAPEYRNRIFEPFFTTKERGKGTGLGLAMVYGTVSQSGGSIEVDSEVGKGTTFRIYFPATEEQAAPAAQKETRPSSAGKVSGTILLVEDEPSLREMISGYLRQTGFTIIDAANGVEGLKKAESHEGHIDLVITDVIMPGMGGRELSDRLRQTHPSTPVLFMSGYTDDASIHRGVSERHNYYIEKPFELNSLARKVREVLSAKN